MRGGSSYQKKRAPTRAKPSLQRHIVSVTLITRLGNPYLRTRASLAFEGELFAAASLLRVSVQQFRVVLSSSSGAAASAVLDSWLPPARFLQLFAAARGHWCNLPARPTPRARQHTILTTPARPWPTVRVPQSGRILSNDEPVVLDLSASGRRWAHSTGSAPTTGLATASKRHRRAR